MTILIFEDVAVERLYPVTIGRPAYAISVGSYRLIDRLAALRHSLRGMVRKHLLELQTLDYPEFAEEGNRITLPADPTEEQICLVNARLVPSRANIDQLKYWLEVGKSGIAKWGSSIAVAILSEQAASTLKRAPHGPPMSAEQFERLLEPKWFEKLPPLANSETGQPAELPLLDYPHDILRHHLAIFRDSLEERLMGNEYREVATGVFLAEGARLGEHVVCDSSRGPILVDANASIGPYCYLRGPVYVGPHSRVIEHAALKDDVALGHTTKIGGEVEASIVEPYTNKQHHGFLGHSYLGSWINLGAGTCNSDLKNTYGMVKMDYGGEKVSTGMQFLGCIIGDYSKTAINTGIFTGKTIGACSMVYGFVTTNVPSFVNYARLFGQVTELPAEVMVATQQRMFARRNVEQRPADAKLLHAMYELTRNERQLAGEPLSL